MLLRRLLSTTTSRSSVSFSKLPKVAVFDLDHTIWPFGIDAYRLIPPYHWYEGKLIDSCQQEIRHFPDIPKVFNWLTENDVKIAVASRTKWPTSAYCLLDLWRFDRQISHFQIYPGQKMKHFERIKQESGADFTEMIFFDDEQRNIVDIGPMGVCAIKVDPDLGVTEKVFQESLAKFAAISKTSTSDA